MNGIDGVLARIQSIESQIGQVSPTTIAALPVLGGAAPSALAGGTGGASGAAAGAPASDLFAQTLAALDPSAVTSATVPTASTAPTDRVPGAVEDTTGLLSSSATADDLIARARTYLGVPYVWGGESRSGMDCSGLVQRSLADLGVDIKRTARQQGTEGRAVGSMDAALPGDLLIFDGGTHVGIYLGDGRMIDAPYAGRNVTERDVYETPTAIRRILPQTDQTVAAAAPALAAPAAADPGLSADVQRMALDMLIGASA
ncbi:hypothetical protein GCM10011331_22780 [Flavimobilis marinus]|uniref:Cell wall-associated hydrolase, NlpC family n=1 Tax=Flavimobilis marinus TaxID=285351 RepID=A0A1I2GPF3_9MICO|nr:C40 family peptidase [Flavimobilis marinus]GHG55830.1 hypothetical protein GCM10011331_22780 [Flavimobilis marinus]SFF19148.1 Cell wall-associated hydrolase, NlpC family [Flavimobilis marinus]